MESLPNTIQQPMQAPTNLRKRKTMEDSFAEFTVENKKAWKLSTICVKSETSNVIPESSIPLYTEVPVELEQEFLDSLMTPLLPHQITALRWMVGVQKTNSSGGVLADDMGLGKTLSCAAFLAYCIFRGQEVINLVVCPKSVVKHWSMELKACNITKVELANSKNKKLNKPLSDIHVIIATFEYIAKSTININMLKNTWGRIIIDEAHTIANSASKAFKVIQKMQAVSKWPVTGTPFSNCMKDIESLAKIATPKQHYTYHDDVKERAWKRSFFLRRDKADIGIFLPKKVVEEWLDMTPHDNDIYTKAEVDACRQYEVRATKAEKYVLV